MISFIMLQGLPGSGKSMVAEELQKYLAERNWNIKIHSSDALRLELFGDMNYQDENGKLFDELHRHIKEDLSNGISVIYDATNLSKRRRIAFLNEIQNIKCYKHCLSIMCPYSECLSRNANRERKIPEEVIKRMYKNWMPPDYSEGFDEISFIYTCDEKLLDNEWSLEKLYKKMSGFQQENKHHSLTLGEHCQRAKEYIDQHWPGNKALSLAASIHDCGKMYTKSKVNARGQEDGNCHYYQHNCVGAYDSVLYLHSDEFPCDEIVYISNLIYYHMRPYVEWVQSERVLKRDIMILGKEFIDDINRLHEADMFAH